MFPDVHFDSTQGSWFTLIELLVIIISLPSGWHTSALSKAKTKAQGIKCMSNNASSWFWGGPATPMNYEDRCANNFTIPGKTDHYFGGVQ